MNLCHLLSAYITKPIPLDETHFVAVRELIQLRSFNKVRQRIPDLSSVNIPENIPPARETIRIL